MEHQDHLRIYREEAHRYQRLVACEDVEGHILPALQEICALDGRLILDLGAGTGRLTSLLAPYASAIYGFDRSPAMLAVARQELLRTPAQNWALAAADHRRLPLPANSADLIISGWSVCYLALHQKEPWREPLHAFFRSLARILRPGGAIILLETEGTGYTSPTPPPFMADYYHFLRELGFRFRWIRTDYRFATPLEAEELTRFFFGDQLADQVAAGGSSIVPECTGIWWLPGVALP